MSATAALAAYYVFGVIVLLEGTRRLNGGITALDIILCVAVGWGWPFCVCILGVFYAIEHWDWLTKKHLVPGKSTEE